MDHVDHARDGAHTSGTAVRDDRLAYRSESAVLHFRFLPDAEAPGEARARAAEVLESSPHLETVLVLVSELVTNAVLHTTHASELRVFRRPVRDRDGAAACAIRVEVRDGDRVVPSSPPVPGAHGGYGLRIVAAIADAWGYTVLEDGKIVWFEVGAGDE